MKKPDLDCLLVHVPKADNHYLPLGDFFNITYMPMGLPAIAEQMRREGLRTEITHLGVEWLVDPSRTVVDLYDGCEIRAIGLDLYWHYQAYDVIEVARALKHAHPEAFIFLGGITAGYFAEEILAEFPFIDAVVKGHGEGATPALIRELTRPDGDLGTVSSLVHRSADGKIGMNLRAPVLPDVLDDLVFADLSVMRHPDVYASTFGFPLAYGREYTAEENQSMLSMARPFFPLFTGRGCPWLCTFCGGNRGTLAKVNGTAKVGWRAPDRVVEDVARARDHGYRTMALCFDPTPMKDDYYVDLFRKVRRAKLDVDFYFECWGLPTRRFVEEFRRTFPSPESYVALSPDAGDEQVRKLNKQPFYTDAELFASMKLLDEFEVSADVFFTIALPGETLVEARTTWNLKRRIATEFANARRVMTWSVQLEPGSPQFERPADYDMITDRSSFLDFYRAHGGEKADTYSSLGFKVNGFFGDQRDEGGIAEFEKHLQHLKCMEFCFLAKDPREWNAPDAGREHCFERRKLLARKRGHREPTLAIGDNVYYEDALAEERAARGERARHSWLEPRVPVEASS